MNNSVKKNCFIKLCVCACFVFCFFNKQTNIKRYILNIEWKDSISRKHNLGYWYAMLYVLKYLIKKIITRKPSFSDIWLVFEGISFILGFLGKQPKRIIRFRI